MIVFPLLSDRPDQTHPLGSIHARCISKGDLLADLRLARGPHQYRYQRLHCRVLHWRARHVRFTLCLIVVIDCEPCVS